MNNEERIPFTVGLTPGPVVVLRFGKVSEGLFHLTLRIFQIEMCQGIHCLIQINVISPPGIKGDALNLLT